LIPNCLCPYCQHIFQPSPYRVQQRVCSQAECQRRRRADYHRQKIRTDPLYAQVVQDSRKQWRSEHADYQKTYWKTHPEAAERNRQRQRRRDRKDRVTSLVKNNVAFSEVLVFQRVVPLPPGSCKEQPSGSSTGLPL
jgi:hypothetical protein